MHTFFAMMDMLPPVWPSALSVHNMGDASEKTALDNMLAASAYFHALHGTEPTEVVNIAVTCDGMWSKRGFTAAYGVVVVISGQVLDYEQVVQCVSAAEGYFGDTVRFAEWMEGHKERCELNFEGSSLAMESEGVLRIWHRSVGTRHPWYTQMI